jgi:hypothetical protein
MFSNVMKQVMLLKYFEIEGLQIELHQVKDDKDQEKDEEYHHEY